MPIFDAVEEWGPADPNSDEMGEMSENIGEIGCRVARASETTHGKGWRI